MENILDVIAIVISVIALVYTYLTFYMTSYLDLNDKLVGEILREKIPLEFSRYIQSESRELEKSFNTEIHNFSDKISFYQFNHIYINRLLKDEIIKIDENFDMYCCDREAKYISSISTSLREIYKILFNKNSLKIYYYEIRSDIIFRKMKRDSRKNRYIL